MRKRKRKYDKGEFLTITPVLTEERTIMNVPLRSCAVLVFLLATILSIHPSAHSEDVEAIVPKKPIRFFQGDKLVGLYTWLQRSKYEDPDNVLTVKDGVLHFSGDGNGYVCTKEHYRDFHLVVEYRWGSRTYGDRKTMARSSGVFLHGRSPDGAYAGQYMAGLECQIIEGGTGDFELIPGNNPDGTPIPRSVSITVETAEHRDYASQPTWKKGGKRVTLADRQGYRVSWFNHDLQWKNVTGYQPKNDLASPGKEWTKLDILCDGDHVMYYVNGVLANEAFDVAPCSGKISLQVEGAEMEFRNFELRPLKRQADGEPTPPAAPPKCVRRP